jgi:hypothetical protein
MIHADKNLRLLGERYGHGYMKQVAKWFVNCIEEGHQQTSFTYII